MSSAPNQQAYNRPLLRALRKTIGHNIQRHRHKRRMLISELAETTGIPEIMIDCYEMGRYRIRLDELLKIACSLKIEVGDLMRAP